MKILRVSLAALGCFAAVSTAQAKELTFYFDVFSSGPEIYPCDAGIWQGEQPKYCHYKGTATNCNPNDLGKTPGQTGVTTGLGKVDGEKVKDYFDGAHACICTGGTGEPGTGVRGGDYLMNFMRYKAATWNGQTGPGTDDNHRGWNAPVEKTAQGTLNGVTVARDIRGGAAKAATDVEQEFKTQLEAVTFNFGSELYGAHFFVDYCYRGPQIPYFLGKDHPQNAGAQFASFAWIKNTNPFTGGDGDATKPTLSYTSLAKVKLKTVMVCDVQGKGKYQFDHNGTASAPGTFDTFLTDIEDGGNIDVKSLELGGAKVISNTTNPNTDAFILAAPEGGTNWVGMLSTPEKESQFGPSNFDLSTKSDQHWLFGSPNAVQYITQGSDNPKTPRFCKLRTYFVEESGKRERAWQRHDARFVTKWLIEENAE